MNKKTLSMLTAGLTFGLLLTAGTAEAKGRDNDSRRETEVTVTKRNPNGTKTVVTVDERGNRHVTAEAQNSRRKVVTRTSGNDRKGNTKVVTRTTTRQRGNTTTTRTTTRQRGNTTTTRTVTRREPAARSKTVVVRDTRSNRSSRSTRSNGRYASADLNRDGRLSPEELRIAARKRR